MITCNLMGGLGNQIFQIFATISYAIKSKSQFKFINMESLGGGSTTVRNTYWKTFFSNMRPFLIPSYKSISLISGPLETFITLIPFLNLNIIFLSNYNQFFL